MICWDFPSMRNNLPHLPRSSHSRGCISAETPGRYQLKLPMICELIIPAPDERATIVAPFDVVERGAEQPPPVLRTM